MSCPGHGDDERPWMCECTRRYIEHLEAKNEEYLERVIASRKWWRKMLVRLTPCVAVVGYTGTLIWVSPSFLAVLPLALVAVIAVWKIMQEGGAE